MLMIYSWINLIEKLPIYSSIQKPNLCRSFSNSGFAAGLGFLSGGTVGVGRHGDDEGDADVDEQKRAVA